MITEGFEIYGHSWGIFQRISILSIIQGKEIVVFVDKIV